MNTNLKDNIQGSVTFQYFRDQALWYQTQTGLIFPVPIDDIGTTTFSATDKAMLFMRWIRKYLASLTA